MRRHCSHYFKSVAVAAINQPFEFLVFHLFYFGFYRHCFLAKVTFTYLIYFKV